MQDEEKKIKPRMNAKKREFRIERTKAWASCPR